MQKRLVTPNEAGQRLDKLLVKLLNKAPKSFIYKMLRKKNITLNNKKADGSEKLSVGDEITLWLADETIEKFSENTVVVVKDHLDIIYEDRDILVMNKPAGVLSQKASPEDISANEELISYLLRTKAITADELQSFHPSVCHRLDRNTSGLLMGGKTMTGLQDMSELIRSRQVGKYYCALVHGHVKEKSCVKGYLVKDEDKNQVKVTKTKVPGSDFIETQYEPLASNGSLTLLLVRLITGRTHQIRAHLAAMGYPVAGDSKYGNAEDNQYLYKKYHLKYQLLHCARMTMPKDTLRLTAISDKIFEAPLPSLFTCILQGEGILSPSQPLPEALKNIFAAKSIAGRPQRKG